MREMQKRMTIGKNLFPEDTYDTPATHRRKWQDRIFGNSRFYFYWHNVDVFRRTGNCAARGELTGERQIEFSNENFRLVEDCGGRIHLRGLDHLRALEGRAVVIISNHMSLLETALLHAIVRPHLDFTFVIKESLFKVPWFGHIMRALKAIPVGRNNPREDLKTVLTEGRRTLAEGRSIILFPQATRTERFDPENFNSIGIKLARSAGVPVLPLALKTDFLGNGRLFRDFGPVHRERDVHLEFAAPLTVSGQGREELQQVIDFINARLTVWGR